RQRGSRQLASHCRYDYSESRVECGKEKKTLIASKASAAGSSLHHPLPSRNTPLTKGLLRRSSHNLDTLVDGLSTPNFDYTMTKFWVNGR
ncbi:unnamed protein product, partial [Choristocarpus tenellus]